ncbi:prolyl oligopeptidase family serine peptidase [Algoriphagus boritolerans]|uniref:carboxylesterase family protein n=1 Tax=Algoriphagus boritolerans TaxID=308111 RepID=UPI000AD89919
MEVEREALIRRSHFSETEQQIMPHQKFSSFFGDGAYVLVPQAPTFWMQGENGMTRGQTNDIYNVALMALIQDFVKSNPKIDPKRIYVGGCSNGGYMSLKLILEHPDYFAAGYISALAYNNEFITDTQVQSIKNVPIWFVHSKDDSTTKPDETVVPLYKRLKEAGAKKTSISVIMTTLLTLPDFMVEKIITILVTGLGSTRMPM